MITDNNTCRIRVYDRDFNWLAEIHRGESVQFTRELYGPGTFEIHIHPDKPGASALAQQGNIIVINRDGHKSGFVCDFSLTESRNGAELVVYGETGAGFAKRRVTVPPTQIQDSNALGWDKIKANAETVIKHYAGWNMISPYDVKRKIPNLIGQTDKKRGIEIPWKSRYARLDEELRNICSYAEMGYEIYADVESKRWIFDVIPGTDRTKGQTAISPVFFNIEYQNVENYEYAEDYRNFRNTGYAGGQGDDENRLIYTIGAGNTGLDRYETFLDCGNAADIDELIYYGSQKLNEFKESKTVEALALPRVFIFEEDYFLGDKVTVYIPRLDLSVDTAVTSVKEIWERPAGYTAEVVFGGKASGIFPLLSKNKEVR